MDVKPVRLRHRGLDIDALWAGPPGVATGVAPGVLLVHDAWGLDDEVAALAGVVARAGFAVLAPDLLGGRRAGDADEARAIAAGLDPEDAVLLLAAAVDALTADPATRPGPIGAVGLGMGAPLAAFLATIRPELAVVVLAGPVPELALDAWAQAEADVVVLGAADGDEATDEATHDAADEAADRADDAAADTADDGAADAAEAGVVDPAVALDRARAAGRSVETVGVPDGDLAAGVVAALAARLRPAAG